MDFPTGKNSISIFSGKVLLKATDIEESSLLPKTLHTSLMFFFFPPGKMLSGGYAVIYIYILSGAMATC